MAGRKFDKCILSEDGTVKFNFMTSLQNIVMAKITNHLWMSKTNLQDIVNFIHSGIRPTRRESSNSWQQIKNKIVANVSELPLPKSMIENLNNIVPAFGNSILSWIRYHECVLNTNEYSAVDQISNITWTARGKIDYAQTAKNILADKNTRLCGDHKYKLACIYCLEDEIAVLAPNVVNQYYLDTVKIHMHPMVYFWTAHITGDNIKLKNRYRDYIKRNNISINGYILQLLINSNKISYKTFNEVPIRYMWGQLNEEGKANNITSLVKELSNQELRYTLLSSLDFEEQQDVFKECSDTILFGLLNDWLWREYFLPTALHILGIMQPSAYLSIINYVTEQMIKNSQGQNTSIYNEYSYIFKQLWQEGSENLKTFIVTHENGYFFKKFLFSLSWERHMDIIGLIFSALNTVQKKETIFESSGLTFCTDLITSDRWDILQLFINYTLSAEEDVNMLKEKMIKCRGEKIAEYFLEAAALDKIEQFLNWAFESETEANHFKERLAHTKIFTTTLQSIISNKSVDFTNLENHFKWCANGDLKLINQFKSEILKLKKFHDLFCELIKEDLYELLDQILNWCFLNDQIKIAQFKSNTYTDQYLWYRVGYVTVALIESDDSFKLLDKFIDWSFTNEQEVRDFKAWVILGDPLPNYCSICTFFLIGGQFELADKTVEWCVKLYEDITQFKNMLMLSGDIKLIFHYFEDGKPDLSLLIKWFNPSEELVAEFKNIFSEGDCPNNFYKLLDDFLQNRRNVSESNEEISVRNLHVNSCFENCQNEDVEQLNSDIVSL